MKKMMILMIVGVFLISIISAVTISHLQLSGYSDSQIKTTMVNNVEYKGYVLDKSDKKIYFYYKILTIEPNIINGSIEDYNTKEIDLRGELSFEDVNWCMNEYSKTVCWNNLVESTTEVDTGIIINPEASIEEQETKKITPVYSQVKSKFLDHYNRVIYYRDEISTPQVDTFVTESGTNVPTF